MGSLTKWILRIAKRNCKAHPPSRGDGAQPLYNLTYLLQINSDGSARCFNLCADRHAPRVVAHPDEHLAAAPDVTAIKNLRVQLDRFELARVNFDFLALLGNDFDVKHLAAIAYLNRDHVAFVELLRAHKVAG